MPIANSNNRTLRISLSRVIKLIRQRKLQQARQILLPLSYQHPHSAAVHGLLGSTYFELGDMTNAAAAFAQVIRLNPKSELASLGLFHSLWAQKRRHQAFAEMQRFLSIAPSQEYAALLQLSPRVASAGAA
jgi:predicted Zn-dependent protease